MTDDQLTRRHVLTLTGGAAALGLAGCLDDIGDDPAEGHGEEHVGVQDEFEAYVVAFHWGYTAFDENGDELDRIEVAPNTELTIHAVNDHAYGAFEALPESVAARLEDFDALGRTKERIEAGELPEPDGQTVEDVYEAAHGHGHGDDDHGDDHGDDGHGDDHGDDGHGDDHGDDGHGDNGHGDDDHDHDHEGDMLDHGFMVPDLDVMMEVPADAHEPETESVVVEEPGTYQAVCTVACGYYHAEQRDDLIHVTEE